MSAVINWIRFVIYLLLGVISGLMLCYLGWGKIHSVLSQPISRIAFDARANFRSHNLSNGDWLIPSKQSRT